MSIPEKKLNVDPRGRINVKQLTSEGVTSYRAIKQEDGSIILRPIIDIEVTPQEVWLYKNKAALKRVQKGLLDAAKGKVKKRGSFSEYVDDEIEDEV